MCKCVRFTRKLSTPIPAIPLYNDYDLKARVDEDSSKLSSKWQFKHFPGSAVFRSFKVVDSPVHFKGALAALIGPPWAKREDLSDIWHLKLYLIYGWTTINEDDVLQ